MIDDTVEVEVELTVVPSVTTSIVATPVTPPLTSVASAYARRLDLQSRLSANDRALTLSTSECPQGYWGPDCNATCANASSRVRHRVLRRRLLIDPEPRHARHDPHDHGCHADVHHRHYVRLDLSLPEEVAVETQKMVHPFAHYVL